MKPHVEDPNGFLKVFAHEFIINMTVFMMILIMFAVGNHGMVNIAIENPSMFEVLVGYDITMSFVLLWLWATMHHNALLFVDELMRFLFKTNTRVSLFA